MSLQYMKSADVPESEGLPFEGSLSLSGAGNSNWIVIPNGVQTIAVTVTPTTATAKVQTTTDTIATLEASGEVAVDWDAGEVSSSTQDVCSPVTAIRLVQVGAGSSIMTVRAQ